MADIPLVLQGGSQYQKPTTSLLALYLLAGGLAYLLLFTGRKSRGTW